MIGSLESVLLVAGPILGAATGAVITATTDRRKEATRIASRLRERRIDLSARVVDAARDAFTFARSATSDRSLLDATPQALEREASQRNLVFRSLCSQVAIIGTPLVRESIRPLAAAHEAGGKLLFAGVPASDPRWDVARTELDRAVEVLLSAARRELV